MCSFHLFIVDETLRKKNEVTYFYAPTRIWQHLNQNVTAVAGNVARSLSNKPQASLMQQISCKFGVLSSFKRIWQPEAAKDQADQQGTSCSLISDHRSKERKK